MTAAGSARRPWRRAFGAAALLLVGALLGVLAVHALMNRQAAELRSWHRIDLEEEFEAGADVQSWSLADYLALEQRLAEAMRASLAAEEAEALSRYSPGSPTNPSTWRPDFNRTFELEPADPRGGALLLHGLSDSPYSMRSVAEALAAQGFYCLALRVPGHGTIPGALATIDWRDWRAAVRLGARAVVGRLEPQQPFVVVGYSNGAALAFDLALDAIDDEKQVRPDRLIFLSPALAVSRLAGLARWQLLLSRLAGFRKLAWTSVSKEHDPYKYNSFALNAASQIHRLTNNIERRLQQLVAAGRAGELPPVLTLQSVVDATVPPISSLQRVYSRLEANGSQLVLFDVNRATGAQAFLSPDVELLLQHSRPDEVRAFDVTLVTNRSHDSLQLVARTRRAGSATVEEEDLGLAWPPGVYSLSHVAIPFPPDDPIYGREPGAFPFPFGAIEPRGERGALVLPMDLLMRLRYNPFFSYLEERVVGFVRPLP